MNWMGAPKTPDQNHEDYLKCVLAMNENVLCSLFSGADVCNEKIEC